ncbi:MAG: hypothetical protein ACXVDN_04685 [Ktedonobacteraceae bacterium]
MRLLTQVLADCTSSGEKPDGLRAVTGYQTAVTAVVSRVDCTRESTSSLCPSPMSTSDGLWCLIEHRDHTGGPARSTSVESISEIALYPVHRVHFLVRCMLTEKACGTAVTWGKGFWKIEEAVTSLEKPLDGLVELKVFPF